jgi:hypothetical protein
MQTMFPIANSAECTPNASASGQIQDFRYSDPPPCPHVFGMTQTSGARPIAPADAIEGSWLASLRSTPLEGGARWMQ